MYGLCVTHCSFDSPIIKPLYYKKKNNYKIILQQSNNENFLEWQGKYNFSYFVYIFMGVSSFEEPK